MNGLHIGTIHPYYWCSLIMIYIVCIVRFSVSIFSVITIHPYMYCTVKIKRQLCPFWKLSSGLNITKIFYNFSSIKAVLCSFMKNKSSLFQELIKNLFCTLSYFLGGFFSAQILFSEGIFIIMSHKICFSHII